MSDNQIQQLQQSVHWNERTLRRAKDLLAEDRAASGANGPIDPRKRDFHDAGLVQSRMNQKRFHTILIAEDNPDDLLLMERAIKKAEIRGQVHSVSDGEEAVRYLEGNGKYGNRDAYPIPTLTFLDLKMPRASGFEVLEWMRRHPDCQVFPTIVLSSSALEIDVRKAYDLGANTFFVKPGTFAELVSMLKHVEGYWSNALKP
jgi:CheY-like chemotaxis protein